MHNQWLLLFFNNLLNNNFLNIDIDNLWSLPQPQKNTKFNPTWWLLKGRNTRPRTRWFQLSEN
jgi:hypothetical protein